MDIIVLFSPKACCCCCFLCGLPRHLQYMYKVPDGEHQSLPWPCAWNTVAARAKKKTKKNKTAPAFSRQDSGNEKYPQHYPSGEPRRPRRHCRDARAMVNDYMACAYHEHNPPEEVSPQPTRDRRLPWSCTTSAWPSRERLHRLACKRYAPLAPRLVYLHVTGTVPATHGVTQQRQRQLSHYPQSFLT